MQKFLVSKKIFFLLILLPFSCFGSEQAPQPLNQRVVTYVSEMSTSQKVLGVAAIGGIAAGGVYLYRAHNKNAPKPSKKENESQSLQLNENPPLLLPKSGKHIMGVSNFDAAKGTKDLESLFTESWNLLWNRKYSSTQQDADVIRSRFSERIVKNSRVYIKVVRQEGKPVAFITYYPKNGQLGHIDLLAVAKDYHRKGYAKALLKAAENHFKINGITSMNIYVSSTNLSALHVYAQFGFTFNNASPTTAFTSDDSQKRFVLLTKTI